MHRQPSDGILPRRPTIGCGEGWDKSVVLPANTTEQEAQKWLSLIPVAISVGLEVYNALKDKDLIVDGDGAGKSVVSPPIMPIAAQGTDPVASGVYKALEKSGLMVHAR